MPEPVSPEAATFGANVRRRRNKLGLSQEQLAEQAEVHWTFVGQVERGRRNISLGNIVKLARGLGCKTSDLMKDVGD